MNHNTWLDFVTAGAQVIFWVTIASVTLLTYLHARRTVLQPLRTEVFKIQLEEMRDVLQVFVGRSESQLRSDACLPEAFQVNVALMYDCYAEVTFPVKIDKKKRPYSECRNWIMKPEALELADNDVLFVAAGDEAGVGSVPRSWGDYTHAGMPIPDNMVAYMERIQRMIESPILPSSCARLLEEYLAILHKNQSVIGLVVEAAASEMPVRYESVERMRAAEINWLHNMWNDEVVPLKPKADEISSFARTYFRSDEFVQGTNQPSEGIR